MVGLDWYDGARGHSEAGCPVLALCLDNGRMQLMRHDADDNAVCIDTGIKPSGLKWSPNGAVRADRLCNACSQPCSARMHAQPPPTHS